MSKRILSLVLALLVGLSVAGQALAAPELYSDVPESHWAAGYVRAASEAGIFKGVGGGKFGVGQPITRAAFATALVRLFGWEEERPAAASYTDVKAGDWYCAAVETARANGALVTGSRTFRPNENITREEMAAMLVRSLGYASLAGTLSTEKSPFSDVRTNKGFITVAYDLGIVSGVGGGRFQPSGTATREQAAAMLVRVHERLRSESARLESADGYTRLSVPTPAAKDSQQLPTTPLEPTGELYAALRALKNGGTDMSTVALELTAGGVQTLWANGRILQSDVLTAEAVAEVLERTDTRTYYSDRYDSAYCIYRPNGYQSAALWYQSEESMAAKLQLARLFGVTHYVLLDAREPEK